MRTLHIADVKVTWWTRLWDWLTYRPWTAGRIARQVAWMRANASYRPRWGRPVEVGMTPVSHLRHSFTFLTAEEIAEREAKEGR